jgi:hypothetical protein
MKKRHDFFAAAGCLNGLNPKSKFLAAVAQPILPMKIDPTVIRRCLLASLAVLMAAGALPARAQTYYNTPFVITNNSTYSPDNIWVSFEGSYPNTGTGQTAGNIALNASASWQSFSLSSMSANVGVPYFSGNEFTFSLNNNVGGRIYLTFGGNTAPLTPPGTPMVSDTTANNTSGVLPYVLLEMTILPSDPAHPTNPVASNMDLSYVDGVFGAATLGVHNGTTGAAQSLNTVNPIKTNSNIIQNVAALVPSAARVFNGTTLIGVNSSHDAATSSNSKINTAYHTWTNLMTTLESKTLKVSSYTSPNDSNLTSQHLNNVLFGYSGAGAVPGQAPNFDQKQNYVTKATFQANLNPTNDATLTGFGITNGTAGVVIAGHGANITGGGTPAGNFSIYITQVTLNGGNGIYGSNPSYVVVPEVGKAYQTIGIVNDLGGRIVGDLMAGMVFGWSNSTTNIAAHATATSLNLFGTIFSAATVGDLSTGEYFYLMSLAGGQGKLSDWIGSAIDANGDNYDPWAVAVSANSDAYGSGFGDRIQGILSPDISWYSANPPANPYDGKSPPGNFETVGFVQITVSGVSAIPAPALPPLGEQAVPLSAGKAQNYSVKFSPKGKVLKDGYTTKQLGKAPTTNNAGVNSSFIITNIGKKPLTGLKITKDGAAAADFTITGLNKKPLPPGQSIKVKVTFRPKTEGNKQAFLHITSNESRDNPFDLTLIGTGMRAKKPR